MAEIFSRFRARLELFFSLIFFLSEAIFERDMHGQFELAVWPCQLIPVAAGQILSEGNLFGWLRQR